MRTPLCISSQHDWYPTAELPTCSIDALAEFDLESVSFLIIELSDWPAAYGQLQQIRCHVNPNIYPKPVLYYGSPDGVPSEVIQGADGLLRPDEPSLENAINTWASKVEPINIRIHQLNELSPEGDSNIAFKVLRFIETRDTEFHPLPSPRTSSGYLYPGLQPLFPKADIGVLETLQYLESQKLLLGQFISRSYACTHCGCAFLNFYETCPDCHSGDLGTDELIHHFKCAYVGELADFKRGEMFVCPKCDRRLKHIGVDYDKASVVYKCRACSNVFQEPAVMTSCYNCRRDTDPENQLNREIKGYAITSIGENAARYGMDSLLQAILETRIHALPFDVFKAFYNLEIARIERYQVSQSCLVILRIRGIDQIYGQLGSRATEVFYELSEALKRGLRSSDVFSVRDETIFLIILTETPAQNADIAISRLKERILNLLASNLQLEFNVDDKIYPLSATVDLEKTMEAFLQTHAD
jgi:hypothetical protein